MIIEKLFLYAIFHYLILQKKKKKAFKNTTNGKALNAFCEESEIIEVEQV